MLNGAFVKEADDLYGDVAGHLHKKGIVAISLTRGVDTAELLRFFSFLKKRSNFF